MNKNNKDAQVYNELSVTVNDKVQGWGYRHQQCLILFFCLTITYCIRSSMGLAILAMIDETKTTEQANYTDISTNYTHALQPEEHKTHGFLNLMMLTPSYPKFKWNKKVQDIILSSFFWGYMLLQIPAGQLAHRFGARRLLSGAMMINCIVSVILPWAAYYGGSISTVICRVLLGMSQACVIPGIHTFFGKWSRLEERGRLTGLTNGGIPMGTVLSLPIVGFIAASPLGWPGIFRFYGLVAGIISLIMWFVLTDSPAAHPKISAAERIYIEECLGHKDEEEVRPKVPWSRILLSRGMFAIIVGHSGVTWGHIVLYSEIPSYLANVMGTDIKANGILVAIPFLAMWASLFFYSWLTDVLIEKKILSVTNSRKLVNTLGSVLPAIGFVALGYIPKNMYFVEALLIYICATKVASHVGCYVNHIDISPNYAGTMMSVSNFVSNLTGSLAPLLTGHIVTDATSEYQWRQVFFVSAGIYFFSNLVYVVLGTAERAEWDAPAGETRTHETEVMLKVIKNLD